MVPPACCSILPNPPMGEGVWATKGRRNGTILQGKPKGQLLGKGPQGRVFFGYFPLALSLTDPLLVWAMLPPLTVFSAPTHKMWLPSMLAKLMMGNWDTMGLISWWEG